MDVGVSLLYGKHHLNLASFFKAFFETDVFSPTEERDLGQCLLAILAQTPSA
jgi:hypothetical protein